MESVERDLETTLVPLNQRILFLKDEARSETKGGIILPGNAKQENLTGRVLAISPDVESDEDYPLRVMDKVLVNPTRAIPVELEYDNRRFMIPIEDVLAIFRKSRPISDES